MPASTNQRPTRCGWRIAWLGVLLIGVLPSISHARNFRLPFASTSQTPHPAVARINVAEKGATSHGSGTLVSVAGQHGLVITNWHVIRDAAGDIMVEFPDGFRSAARVLKVDQDWDLAALQIWRPTVEPVSLAVTAPRLGDTLAIAGYGSGQYRTASGRCTQYVAPGANFPYEMVELSAEARQGDSGGPIFNEQGELAGVLFGASRGTTSGSYCGRVRLFLAPFLDGVAAPENAIAPAVPSPETRTVVGGGSAHVPGRSPSQSPARAGTPALPDLDSVPQPPPQPAERDAFARVEPYFGASPRMTPSVDLTPPAAAGSFAAPIYRDTTPIGGYDWNDSNDVPLLSSAKKSSAAPWEDIVGKTPLEQGKSVLAGIGILAVLLRLSNVLSGSRD